MSEYMWSLYKKCGQKKAQCVLCNIEINYTQISDLRKHLTNYHYDEINILEIRRNKNPFLSKHFTSTECEYIAECIYCGKSLSYRTNICNLKKHLRLSHPDVYSKYVGDESNDIIIKQEEDITYFEDASNGVKIEPQVQTTEDMEKHFEKIPSNQTQCNLYKETFSNISNVKSHMIEKHRNITMITSSDSEDDLNCFKEVVYLEDDDEEPVMNIKDEPLAQESRKRRHSSMASRDAMTDGNTTAPEEEVDDVANFGRYVTGLLRNMPDDLCMQLQMDIINLIVTTKLNKMATFPPIRSVRMITNGIRDGGVTVSTPNIKVNTTNNGSLRSSKEIDK